MAYHGITLDEHVFYCGVLPDYKACPAKIIQSCSCAAMGYEDYIASLFPVYSAVGGSLAALNRKKPPAMSKSKIERAAAHFQWRTITQKIRLGRLLESAILLPSTGLYTISTVMQVLSSAQ